MSNPTSGEPPRGPRSDPSKAGPAILWLRVAPGRALDGGVHLGLRGQIDLGLDLAGRGVEDIGGAAGRAGRFLAVDPVVNGAHDRLSPDFGREPTLAQTQA